LKFTGFGFQVSGFGFRGLTRRVAPLVTSRFPPAHANTFPSARSGTFPCRARTTRSYAFSFADITPPVQN